MFQDDNASVGHWIVKLLIKNYYKPKMAVIEWTKRFIYLIKTYSKSYRNFFFYSNKSLSFKDACTIIYEILNQLGMYVLSKSEEDLDESENIIEKPVEKKKRKKTPLSEINGFDSVEKPKPATVKKCAFDDPEVVSGLFDIVTILWVLHDIELNKSENEEMRLKLYDTYIKYAQPFINYYKVCFYFEFYFVHGTKQNKKNYNFFFFFLEFGFIYGNNIAKWKYSSVSFTAQQHHASRILYKNVKICQYRKNRRRRSKICLHAHGISQMGQGE